MTIEASFVTIDLLNTAYPETLSAFADGEDHMRGIKTAIKGTFPNLTGAVTPTHTVINAALAGTAASTKMGGTGHTTSGTNSAAIGGSTNTTSGINSAVLGGETNTASSSGSGVIAGANCTADGVCALSHGQYATARGVAGAFSGGSSGATSTLGQAQKRELVLFVQTTDATANVVMKSTAAAAGVTNQLTLANNQSAFFDGLLIGHTTGLKTVSYTIRGTIRRGANAAATAVVAACTITKIDDDTAGTGTPTVVADTTNGCLAVRVTGIAATTINWVCWIRAVEVSS